MKLFDFFKNKEAENPFEDLFKRVDKGHWQLDPSIESEILTWNDEQKTALILVIIHNSNRINKENIPWNNRNSTLLLTAFLSKRKILFGNQAIVLIKIILESLKIIIENKEYYDNDFDRIISPILNNMLRFHKFESQDTKDVLNEIKDVLNEIKLELEAFGKSYHNREIKKTIQKIEVILFEGTPNSESKFKPTYFIGEDGFKDYGNKIIDNQDEKYKNICFQIIAYAQKASGSKPSQKYLNETKLLIEQLGNNNFKKITLEWFEFIIGLKDTINTHTNSYYGNTYQSIDFLNPLNADALKGIVWMCSKYHDNKTIQTISKLAERCFKKIPGKGQAAASLGNACLYTLFASKGLDGIAQLSKLKLKIKQNSTLNLIENYIKVAADKLGISAAEVEDLAVDDFKLENNQLEIHFDNVKAVLELTSIGKSVIRWYKEDGKEQKTVPQLVKDKFADKLKKLKDKQKQIDQTTFTQKERFDRMLRSNRILSIDYFKKQYLNHGLLAFVIHKVIFQFLNDKESILAIFIKKQWITIGYKEIEIDNYTNVTLWHPANSTTQEVKEWRQFLMDSEIQQPFKQAYREIYLLTDAEINTRTYSNRMASHILKQHQYVALAKGRNWKAKLIGFWYSGDQDTAELYLPEYGIKVEYWVNALNADNQFNDTGIWNYVTTDQIRFIKAETRELIPLIDVPAIAFSEVMRDIDLFVGVASVGNDPTWQDSGGLPTYRDYWQSYSFGDLSEVAKNRKEILQSLIPRLKIASVTQILDKFLVVKGKLRTYKIHIGSTNILMEPNDQYLCVVPDRSNKNETGNIFLPFEGDNGLSVIISKAFLLANDDKITDSTITSQINR